MRISKASFAGRLRRARADAGLSQRDLERLSGIPKSRISRYENGHLLPSIGGLRRLSGSLGVADSALLGDPDEVFAAFVRSLKGAGVSFASTREAKTFAWLVAEMFRSRSSPGLPVEPARVR